MKYTLTILFFAFFISAPPVAAENIWDVADQKFISAQSLKTKLANARNILMGLQRDNSAHYRLAAKVMGDMAATAHKPVILLGTIERNKQNAFAIFARRHRQSSKIYDATGLDMLLDWPHSGQGDWAVARPVFDLAMEKKLSLRAVAFSRYEIGRLHHDGPGGLPGDVRDDLLPLISTPLPEKTKSLMRAEIRAAYCADLPPDVINRLILIDRAQNSLIALAMNKPGQRTILVATRKYILHDSGVPRYLKELKAKNRTVSLLFSEFTQKIQTLKVDFIWFTNRIPRPDPCRSLKINQP